MSRFFSIEDRSFRARGMPWIGEFTHGVVTTEQCRICKVTRLIPWGDMRARLWEDKGTQWPDLIGTGHLTGLLVASGRFVEALQSCGVRVELGGRVEFEEPGPKRLALVEAPDYYWVDGEQHLAAKMDFAASGFVGVEYCPGCGAWSDDVKAPRRSKDPYVFDYDASSGLDLFTTDMSTHYFFCTERVLECAREYKLTNVAIIRLEDGPLADPIKYW